MPSGRVVVLVALMVSAAAPHVAALDADGDNLPDEIESQLCGRVGVSHALRAVDTVAGSGRCDGSRDFVAGSGPHAEPDALLCGLEDRNTDADGYCADDGTGNVTYHPPPLFG